jgi:hypothetical protein
LSCLCTTLVNGGADELAALADQYQSLGCHSGCAVACTQWSSATCVPEPASPTGGMCEPATGVADGG